MSALSLSGLVAGYEPDLPIVRGVDLDVPAGDFLVLLGPNGAGKSTLVKAIAGVVPVHAGRVTLGDVDMTSVPAHEKSAAGLAFVPQTENIFATLSIEDNLRIACAPLPRRDRAARIAAAYARFPDLGTRPARLAGALSGGQRQMLAIARALVLDPPVLMLDEPSAGLSPRIVGEVMELLAGINAAGVTVLLVEQNVKAALSVARRAVILVEGRIRHAGAAASLADDPVVAELYLGGGAEARA